MKIATLILLVLLALTGRALANDSDSACMPISGTVDVIDDGVASLELPWGGFAYVSARCLPVGAEEGTVVVRGRVDRAETRRELARVVRLMAQMRRMGARRVIAKLGSR